MNKKRSGDLADASSNLLEELRDKACCLPYSHPDYEPPIPEDVDAVIRAMGWTQGEAAQIVGVSWDAQKGSTTLRKWRAPRHSPESREIPYAAWRLLLIHAGLAVDSPASLSHSE